MGVREEDCVLVKLFGSSITTKGKSALLAPVPEMASLYMPKSRLEARNSLKRFKAKLKHEHEGEWGWGERRRGREEGRGRRNREALTLQGCVTWLPKTLCPEKQSDNTVIVLASLASLPANLQYGRPQGRDKNIQFCCVHTQQ